MNSISEKVQSLGSSVGGVFSRPKPELLNTLQENLASNSAAREYLTLRGLTDVTISHFRLGYDAQKNAIAIPVFKRGELINIKYRLITPQENEAKYLGTRGAETYIFNEEGIQSGMKKKWVLVVEGEFDAMLAHQNGFDNVVSPASGKDSYGIWLEMLDTIPRVYIAYDNDKPGREASVKFAARVGQDKSFEVLYPEGIKDANDYFLKHTNEDFKELLKTARPYYKHTFKSITDIIEEARADKELKLILECIPGVKLGPDWVMAVSAATNVGKTSFVLNIAAELAEKEIPVLILPFERGVQSVGMRYFGVKYGMTEEEVGHMSDADWSRIKNECITSPVYLSVPTRNETIDVIRRSKRIFNTRVVIVDHLDLMVRKGGGNDYERQLAQAVQELKEVAQECQVIIIMVHHIRKINTPGARKARKPGLDDLKGSSAVSQDPEVVVMLYSELPGQITVAVLKNKGAQSTTRFAFNLETGKLGAALPEGVSASALTESELANLPLSERKRLEALKMFDDN